MRPTPGSVGPAATDAPPAPPDAVAVPSPRARAAACTDPVDLLERRAASIADLVLKLSSLADRYEQQLAADPRAAARATDSRLRRLRAAAARGQRGLRDLAGTP